MGLLDPADRHKPANQPDIVLIGKDQKTAVVIDVGVPSGNNIRKNGYEKLEKYQVLKEELERIWKVKDEVDPIVIEAFRAVTLKVGEWLQ